MIARTTSLCISNCQFAHRSPKQMQTFILVLMGDGNLQHNGSKVRLMMLLREYS